MTENNSFVAEEALLTSATVTVTADSAAAAFAKALDHVDRWAERRHLVVSIERYEIVRTGKSLTKGDVDRFEVRMF